MQILIFKFFHISCSTYTYILCFCVFWYNIKTYFTSINKKNRHGQRFFFLQNLFSVFLTLFIFSQSPRTDCKGHFLSWQTLKGCWIDPMRSYFIMNVKLANKNIFKNLGFQFCREDDIYILVCIGLCMNIGSAKIGHNSLQSVIISAYIHHDSHSVFNKYIYRTSIYLEIL